MAAFDPELAERMLNRFRRLMQELERGTMARNAFEPWEVDLLMDILTTESLDKRRAETLRQYRRAAEKHIESGGGPPLRLSEFLAERERNRQARHQERSTRLP